MFAVPREPHVGILDLTLHIATTRRLSCNERAMRHHRFLPFNTYAFCSIATRGSLVAIRAKFSVQNDQRS